MDKINFKVWKNSIWFQVCPLCTRGTLTQPVLTDQLTDLRQVETKECNYVVGSKQVVTFSYQVTGARSWPMMWSWSLRMEQGWTVAKKQSSQALQISMLQDAEDCLDISI